MEWEDPEAGTGRHTAPVTRRKLEEARSYGMEGSLIRRLGRYRAANRTF